MEEIQYDWDSIFSRLNRCLRLKTTPICMKRFHTAAEMETVPKIRRVREGKYTICQMAAQASRLNFTVGFTREEIYGIQCLTIMGMLPQSEEFLSGNQFKGVWYGTLEDSAKHQANIHCAVFGDYEAAAFSPLQNGRLNPPELCMLYLNPGQMIYMINGLQYVNYEVINISAVGESSCSDAWGKALLTGKPCVSIPCYAERRYGAVLDDELLICLTPEQLQKAVDGMESLGKNGLRYPYAPYGIQNDCTDGMSVSYKK